MRRYFDFAKVRQGLLDVTSRLFGVVYTPVDAPVDNDELAPDDDPEFGERVSEIKNDAAEDAAEAEQSSTEAVDAAEAEAPKTDEGDAPKA